MDERDGVINMTGKEGGGKITYLVVGVLQERDEEMWWAKGYAAIAKQKFFNTEQNKKN